MPVPTTYTDATLAVYAQGEVRDLAEMLGWSLAAGDFEEAVTDALLACGLSAASGAASSNDIRRLRAEVVLAALRRIRRGVASRYDFTSGDQSFSRSQAAEMVDGALAEAERTLLEVGGDGMLVGRIRIHDDEYEYRPDEFRTRV